MSENLLEQFNTLPINLASHLKITVIALAAGVLISLPLAVWLVRRPRWRYPFLTGAGVIQTIPSLALLALMVPIIDATAGLGLGLAPFGLYPAVIALTLYSILPILRNTVTGITGVDSALTEAARGVGMTGRQMLFRVELPLAAPVIIAGIRTATVWVVGIATLATPVGQRCLGNYIFTGLQTRNWTMVLFGVVAAAGLAIVLDVLIGGMQRASEQRNRRLAVVCGSAIGVIIISGLIAPSLVSRTGPGGAAPLIAAEDAPDAVRPPVIRIGSKTFTEQYILAALIENTLREAGLRTERIESLGSTVAFDALVSGDLHIFVDYSGTIWANYMNRTDLPPRWWVMSEMSGWLARRGVRHLGPLGFENAYAVVMRSAQARELGVTSIADLAEHASTLRIAGDYEFFGRPEWAAMRDGYGLGFREEVSMDSTLMYEAVARGDVDAIVAFSSDGRITAYDLVALDDPREVIPPYDAVLLLGPSVANDPLVSRTLGELIDAIPVELMREANLMVDRDEDKQTVSQAARWLAERIGEVRGDVGRE